MKIDVPTSGQIRFCWQAKKGAVTLLLVRTGAAPGYAHWTVDAAAGSFTITNLGRHQRYLCGALDGDEVAWRSIVGESVRDEEPRRADIAAVERVHVLPQSQRLTLYWKLGRGFVSHVRLRVGAHEELLSPEVTSVVLDAARVQLQDGRVVQISLTAELCGVAGRTVNVSAVPAAAGEERRANVGLAHIVYPCVDLGDEQDPFAEAQATVSQPITCGQCRAAVRWVDYRLVCSGCGAEYVPNGRGDYLSVAALRFGTCRCCLPKKVLISEAEESLRCAHSRKEYVRLPGEQAHRLIEDLPYGLCQCCRPRRPLHKRGEDVRCTKSDERHHVSPGVGFVLVPSAPVFDATKIDELLDAGLAELSGAGVSRAR